MAIYFQQIDDADIVIIINEKNGQEYCGVGTIVELGHTLKKYKLVEKAKSVVVRPWVSFWRHRLPFNLQTGPSENSY